MAKGYWVSCYRAVHDADKLKAYAELAGPAVEKHGGRFVVRNVAAEAKEGGMVGRTVVVEWPSLDVAKSVYGSDDYAKALDALRGGVDRDFRIVEGVD